MTTLADYRLDPPDDKPPTCVEDLADEEKPVCPLHGRYDPEPPSDFETSWSTEFADCPCPKCGLRRENFGYELITKPDLYSVQFSRHATSAEKGHAQPLVSFLELWTGEFLAYLADITPSEIMHACEVCEWSYPNVDPGMVPVLLLHLAAQELAKAQAELQRLRAGVAERRAGKVEQLLMDAPT
jgi:hypothetical protein